MQGRFLPFFSTQKCRAEGRGVNGRTRYTRVRGTLGPARCDCGCHLLDTRWTRHCDKCFMHLVPISFQTTLKMTILELPVQNWGRRPHRPQSTRPAGAAGSGRECRCIASRLGMAPAALKVRHLPHCKPFLALDIFSNLFRSVALWILEMSLFIDKNLWVSNMESCCSPAYSCVLLPLRGLAHAPLVGPSRAWTLPRLPRGGPGPLRLLLTGLP